jgi:GNAT superfamily N-acetyltransferase
MNSRFRQQFHELGLSVTRRYAQVEARPWGHLVHNVENPEHWDANTARWVRAEDPAAVIEEVVDFYLERGLLPRVRLDDLSTPEGMAERLAERGFHCESKALRLMRWEPVPILSEVPPEGVTLEVAGLDAVESLATLLVVANGWEGHDWAVQRLKTLVTSPTARVSLARVRGVPAAMALMIEGEGCALVEDVATHPAYRRRGLATLVMAHLRRPATVPLFLQVSNPEAERIYTRAGFQVLGQMAEVDCHLRRE